MPPAIQSNPFVPPTTPSGAVASEFNELREGVQGTSEDVVTKMLSDGNDGIRHWRLWNICILAMFVILALYVGYGWTDGPRIFESTTTTPAGEVVISPPTIQSNPFVSTTTYADALAIAFNERRSGDLVTGEGVVTRILCDDNEGSRHQRFILRLASDQTILIAHNIDLASRIASLRSGDSVAFFGVYEWNSEGGVIHWTHHDPVGRHPWGWLKHSGQIFQ